MGHWNVDWDATRKLKGGSRVFIDGREVLGKADWKKRKVELAVRSGGNCERLSILGKPHAPGCDHEGTEPHHIVRRSKQRDDRLSNLAALSHACHLAEDERKVRWTKESHDQN